MADDIPQLDPRVLVRNFAMPENPVPAVVAVLPPATKRDARATPVPARPAAPNYRGEPDSATGSPSPNRKPFGFALEGGINGARIYFGALNEEVTKINFVRKATVGTVLNVLASQPMVTKVNRHDPANLSADFGYKNATDLTWFGDVWLYWEVSKQGDVTMCDVRGPDKPEEFQIPKLTEALTRDWGAHACAKYCALIGTVDPTTREITQHISGDVTWAIEFIPEAPNSLTPLTVVPTVVKELAYDSTAGHERPQVRVDDGGIVAGQHIYTVKGNGVDGELMFYAAGLSSPVTLIQWRDGLIITPGTVTFGVEAVILADRDDPLTT